MAPAFYDDRGTDVLGAVIDVHGRFAGTDWFCGAATAGEHRNEAHALAAPARLLATVLTRATFIRQDGTQTDGV